MFFACEDGNVKVYQQDQVYNTGWKFEKNLYSMQNQQVQEPIRCLSVVYKSNQNYIINSKMTSQLYMQDIPMEQ